jgi:hypothetical protein
VIASRQSNDGRFLAPIARLILSAQLTGEHLVGQASACLPFVLPKIKTRRAKLGGEKGIYFCHSEVAAATEESLFDLNAGKERFLGARRASERQKFVFFRKLRSKSYFTRDRAPR